MNRIYQGKVTKVEVSDGKGGWHLLGFTPEEEQRLLSERERLRPLTKQNNAQGKEARNKIAGINRQLNQPWQDALWQHHQLFQDAVNYYTLCLANLAEGADEEHVRAAGQKRPRVTAMSNWRKEVQGQWNSASKKSRHFEGPHAALVKRLSSMGAHEAMSFGELEKIILRNAASPEVRLRALLYLLDLIGIGGKKKPTGKKSTDPKELDSEASQEAKLTQKSRKPLMPNLFQSELKSGTAVEENQQLQLAHAAANKIIAGPLNQIASIAEELSLEPFFSTPPKPEKALKKEAAAKRLKDCLVKAGERYATIKPLVPDLKKAADEMLNTAPEKLTLPHSTKCKGEFYAMVAFKFFPSAETFEAARKAATTILKKKVKVGLTSDPLFDLRVNGKPPFDFFANIALSRRGRKNKQGNWFEFDLAAFVEALKSPHRYYQDTQKREAEAETLQGEIRLMETRGKIAEGEEEQIYGFAEDERFELIKQLVASEELRTEAEAEGDFEPGESIEYGISERTLRGFDEVRRKWLRLVERGEPNEQQLRDVVAHIQADHPLDFGSATLFLELTKPKYHPIWRSTGTKEWHAPNALRAWMDFRELRRELKDKERPIRFTPAHPVESPRYFSFPKASETKKESGSQRAIKPGLVSRHLPGELAFYAGVALATEEGREPTPVKITFSAPRLFRDELRAGNAAENLRAARWLQPIIKALPFSDELDRQNFANCRVTLQPDKHDRQNIQLTFPVAIQSATLTAKLEKAARWSKQFYGYGKGREFTPMALRWPHETKAGKDLPDWPSFEQFSLLAVDLGQRTAGAFARLEVSADAETKGARFIGETEGRKWHAHLREHELLRLSGEDRKEWREGAWREELFGSKGRMSIKDEIDEAQKLLKDLRCDEAEVLPVDWQSYLSFPEINDGLLRGAKRALAHYGRLHRWRWFLTLDQSKQETAQDEMKDSEEGPLTREQLDCELEKIRLHLPRAFCALANRVLPLRGRRWNWRSHPERPDCYLLDQVPDESTEHARLRGQRGLSFARLEQIEELRKRFQSLNQLMRRVSGQPPNKRRDESIPDPCPDILDKLDRTKEQRVNQTAHMILAEALGVTLQPPPVDKAKRKQTQDLHGVYAQVRDPVDFIVIENLSRYRTSQGRAPRENNRLMKWSHRAIRDKLKELCEPFGIPVLETPAAYSSRFCARSGVAGFRAVELTARALQQPRWKRLCEKIDNKQELSTEEKDATKFVEMLRNLSPTPNGATLLAPQAGGPIFVPFTQSVTDAELPPALAQADINAAINLGLRAIADPRFLRIHPRLRTNKRRFERLDGKEVDTFLVNERRMFGEKSNVEVHFADLNRKREKDDSRLPNFFFDVSRTVGRDKAKLIGGDIPSSGNLVSAKALWSTVKDKQWPRVLEINQKRLDDVAAAEDSDEIPM